MADPIAYESFGRMIFEHAPFIIAGGVAIIGITTMIWKKLGFLTFDKEKRDKDSEMCKHCSFVNGNTENAKALEELKRQVKCDSHDSLCETVKTIRATQLLMEQQQKTNIKSLSNGKDEFGKLHTRISAMNDKVTDLRIGMAVLLNKSGTKIKEFDDIKVE